MDTPTLEALTTVAGASVVVFVLAQVLWRAWSPTPAVKDRIGPLVALGLGVAVTLFGTFAIGIGDRENIALAILNGIFAGASAMGIHDTLDSVTG